MRPEREFVLHHSQQHHAVNLLSEAQRRASPATDIEVLTAPSGLALQSMAERAVREDSADIIILADAPTLASTSYLAHSLLVNTTPLTKTRSPSCALLATGQSGS